MTTLHPIRVADAAATTKLDPTMLEAQVKRDIFVLASTENLSDITQGTGQIALAVARNGALFFYQSGDSTTVDDGVTCLVDASGHRYLISNDHDINTTSVLSVTNTPPGSPTVGDAYVCDTSPTGAWSGKANAIAYYSRRGWIFETPAIGRFVLNQATDLNTQFNDSGAWAAFAGSYADGSIRPRALEWELGIAVESTPNTPPGSPSVGLYYIVGAIPTGAWSGKAGKVATYYNSAWEFIDPYEGADVYHRANGYQLFYQSGVWTGQTFSQVQEFATAGSFTWTKPSFGTTVHIECWGGGGSGGRSSGGTRTAGGGGGGSFTERWMKLSELSATETVTVGAGGASKTTDGAGAAGGNSSLGTKVTAYGGAAGFGNTGGGGGGGGGSEGAATTGAGGLGDAGTAGGAAASPGGSSTTNAGGGGSTGTSLGGSSRDGGGGGGGGSNGGGGGTGGKSRRGGGGGGGTSGPASGGTSTYGGNGGAAADSANATAGSQPSGGGGAAWAGNSGKGGDGMVRVTVW